MTEITLKSFKQIKEDHKNLLDATSNACAVLKIALTKTPGYGNVSLDVEGDKIRVSGFKLLSEFRYSGAYEGGIKGSPYVSNECSQIRSVLFYGTEIEFYYWLSA